MVELYCPNCMKPLQVLHDDRHDETYCRNCGIILRCPPSAEIITPKIIISDKEEGGNR